MSIADQKLREIREQVQTHLASVPARLTPERQKAFEEKIREQLKAHNAVIVAHYYTSPEIQALAEATGGCVSDSLEMARFGRDHPAETLLVAGVRFMGETAKILTPQKRVLMRTSRQRGGCLREYVCRGEGKSRLGSDVKYCPGCCRALG